MFSELTSPFFRHNTQIFYIYKPYLFLNIYDLLNIPHLPVTFVYTTLKFLLQLMNILHLSDISFLSSQWQLMYSLFGRYIYFSLFMQITYETMCCCSVHNKSSLIP